MLSLHTNAATLSTQNSLSTNNKNLTSSMTKLGTGLRVNSAMDDAAGLQIATRLNAQSRGMQVAQKNTQNGISMLQTAEGAMNEINNMLLRMKDLATESANGTSSADDRTALQAEYNALGKEIGNILKNTTFGGSHLFSHKGMIGKTDALKTEGLVGKADGISFQVGATTAETVSFKPGATGGSLASLLTALTATSDHITDSEEYTITPGTPPTVTALGATPTDAELDTWYEENAKLAYYNLNNTGSTLGAEILTGASAIIDTINTAINAVGTFRSDIGAVANRLDHTYNNLANMITNTETAKGRIMDVDYATETSNMTKNQMLMQASSAMLKQSNSMSQMVSSLLQ